MNYEVRHSAELQTDGKNFVGYAARWFDPQDNGTEYKLAENLVERIQAGAFRETLADGHNIRGVYNHETAANLGSTKAKTLELSEDGKGLRFRIPYDETDPDHQRAMAKVKRGEIGSSFRFMVRPGGQQFSKGVRTLTALNLEEITLTPNPAYTATTVEARCKDYDEWQANQIIWEKIAQLPK